MHKISILFAAVVSACFQSALAQSPFQVTVDPNNIWVRAGESPVFRYRCGDVPFKPYVKELYTPGGLNVLLDAPTDHLHHHGLMFAVAADGVNFWEETPTAGRQGTELDPVMIHHVKRGGGQPCVVVRVIPAWRDASGRGVTLLETRLIEACRVEKLGATVVTWQSKLDAPPRPGRPVTLSGSHYFGLGMRFVRAMDGGEFFNADGKEGTIFRGEERLVRSDWCAYTAAIDGKLVTVAMLGHPANPRSPTTWFTMAKPFAYLSATLNLHEESLSFGMREPLMLRYAVVAWDGRADVSQINQAYRWFLDDYWRSSTPLEGVDSNDKSK